MRKSGRPLVASSGAPVLPAGLSKSVPLLAARSGTDVAVSWDVASCPAAAYHVYRGTIGDFTTFTSGACDLPPTGSAVVAMPDDAWFLVVATDGAATDGSWSRTADGSELSYAGASLACPAITAHAAGGACP